MVAFLTATDPERPVDISKFSFFFNDLGQENARFRAHFVQQPTRRKLETKNVVGFDFTLDGLTRKNLGPPPQRGRLGLPLHVHHSRYVCIQMRRTTPHCQCLLPTCIDLKKKAS